ncbi:glutamate--tRNA ligase [Candidatus Kaiserbacteria bacterium]|nr:glutamate--tRNA ligase [Candidatus Kaiserbacteria bacterium]
MPKVRTRIAPSPTGYLHIGNARTALFNFLFARHQGGTFVLRLEDTDKERSKKEYADDIFEQFKWLGLAADETYIQSEHVERHRELLHTLVSEDKAYISSEPAKDDPIKTVEVVRLRNPGRSITFHDLIRGDITFDTTELKDFVIARSIDEPLYHFAVVADDGEADITHVIRGEDHISNTPRQILIQEALDLPRPIYAHLPLIMAPDKTKLSKRKHQTSVKSFRELGFLPEAMTNFMALLGWNPGTPQELFSMQELIDSFSLENVQKSSAIFDIVKLRWFNREYLNRMGEDDFQTEAASRLAHAGIQESAYAERLLPILRERIEVWSDIDAMFAKGGELFFASETPRPDPAKIPWKGESSDAARKHLEACRAMLEQTPDAFQSAEALKALLWPYADENGRGSVLWPLRYALTGADKSPDPFTVAYILGREETLTRIGTALARTPIKAQ